MRNAKTPHGLAPIPDLGVSVNRQPSTSPLRRVRSPNLRQQSPHRLSRLERLTAELRQMDFHRLLSGALLYFRHGHRLWPGEVFVIILLIAVRCQRIANIHHAMSLSISENGICLRRKSITACSASDISEKYPK